MNKDWNERKAARGLGLALALLLLTATSAFAQRELDRSRDRWDEPRPIAPTPAEAFDRVDDGRIDEQHLWRAGLFREGAHLLAVRATLRHDEESGYWMAELTLDEPGVTLNGGSLRPPPVRKMRLLPNSFLTETQRLAQATPKQKLTFELTGETFVYQRRNYLLLRAPSRVIAISSLDESAEKAPEPAQVQPRASRTASDVMRDLERQTGPLARAASPPAARDVRIERLPHREGDLITYRRGRVTRDTGGSWIFVFDADAQGLADPPLTLMPCLLLERIERYARQAGPTAPILISGQVFIHEGRGHLLPSSFQLPREKTPLN